MSPRHIDPERLSERENELIEIALEMIRASGVGAFTIDQLAESVPFSKGTIYNHFSSKEDLLAAACNRGLRTLHDLFLRAGQLGENTRERITGLCFGNLIYSKCYPVQFRLVISANLPSFFEKSSKGRIDDYQQLQAKLLDCVLTVVDDAIENQELPRQQQMDTRQIAFTIWSAVFGTIVLLHSENEFCRERDGLEG